MTIRLKLTMLVIAIILVVNSALSLVGVQYVGRIWMQEIQNRVRLDLSSAEGAYEGKIQQLTAFLHASSLSDPLFESLAERGNRAEIDATARKIIDRIHASSRADFVTLMDLRGNVVFRAAAATPTADNLAQISIVQRAIDSQQAVSGTILLTAEELARENPELVEQARFELVDTPAALPTKDRVRDRGLVMAAVVPICNLDGVVAGYLFGGNLVNRRNELVDEIRQKVYFGAAHKGQPVGTVTVFLDDLRIATNVLDSEGNRAEGTRMSAPVYEKVIRQGKLWDASAFVVREWYITAYQPIRDPDGQILGALYVGLRQSPFDAQRNAISRGFLAAVFLVTVTILILLIVVTRWVLGPITRVTDMCHRVIAGDRRARVGIRPSGEMGVLCEAVDEMAESIQEHEHKLKQKTRQQIGRSEKLASIGRLAAGIAHEINNPMTGVLTFAHLMRDRQPEGTEDREDLEMIIQQTERVAEIVRGLLDFARERSPVKEPLDINEVIQSIVRLVENQKEMRMIHIERNFAADLPDVLGDSNQLQQVLLNLFLNSAHAMPDGGILTIGTSLDDVDIVIRIEDSGCGIPVEDLDKIFDPFFTTKPVGQGTGLGLSVSYGIIEQHGGTIEVTSEVDSGSQFTIRLPVSTDETAGIVESDDERRRP
jgi:two-component system NtrC family sensor kinase